MDRLFLLVIGLFFGAGVGYIAAATSGATLDGHDHGNPAHHAGGVAAMDHAAHDQPLELPPGEVPTLAVTLHPEPGAVAVEIATTGFAFAPGHSNGPHVPGEGHAHLYADGVKLGRIYAPWSHWTLPPGTRQITVTLNANDHRPLAAGGQPVSVTLPLGEE